MPPRKRYVISEDVQEPTPSLHLTQAQEVYASVIEWYKNRNEIVPKEDIDACEQMIREEKEEMKRNEEFMANPPPPVIQAPTFGSNDYWKDYWAKKKAAGYVTKKDLKKDMKKVQK